MFVHYTVCLTSSVHPLDPILASLDVLPVVSEVDLPLLEPDTYSGISVGLVSDWSLPKGRRVSKLD